jgi:hypothetical protein
MIVPTTDVQTTFGRPLLTTFRHQANRMRPMPQGNLEHFLGRSHLEIERALDARHEQFDVGVPDMPPVFPQMGRNSICPSRLCNSGSAQRIGMIPATWSMFTPSRRWDNIT